ncbi:DUF883 domain-containing protein [uncultured Sulfitobacter sp.]
MAAKNVQAAKDVTVEDLSVQISILKDDIAALTSSVSTYGKTATRDAANQAKTAAHDYADLGKAKAAEAQQNAEDFIRTQPATAMGIAAGVGFLIGLIAARR